MTFVTRRFAITTHPENEKRRATTEWSRPSGSKRLNCLFALAVLTLAACSDGGSSSPAPSPVADTPPAPTPTPTPPPTTQDQTFDTMASTGRFLTQATFGPSPADLDTLPETSASDWFMDQLAAATSLNLPYVTEQLAAPDARNEEGDLSFEATVTPGFSFWINAVTGEDQLRQRMAFALSQIFVVSNTFSSELSQQPVAIAAFMDILARNALGNYRDIMEEVTYSTAMGVYLTYLQNLPGDPLTGRVPDENYAREIMQLFTIGLVELGPDGEPVLDGSGQQIETYTNADVTGLASVFTGLSFDVANFFFDFGNIDDAVIASPMAAFPEFHADIEKTFLGLTIPANTGPVESIDMALDHLFAQPSLPPFVCRQLIQRFVTSDPDPAYVARVVTAFESGSFALPDGRTVGTGARGDLAATIAAILFDLEARDTVAAADNDFGKLREPVIRFVNWARAFDVSNPDPRFSFSLFNASGSDALNQHPYRAPSVFNFYRPGYVAPGTLTGAEGNTAPELQITNASSIPGYINFITFFAGALNQDFFDPADPDFGAFADTFIPDYSTLTPLADDPAALVTRLDELLTFGTLTPETRSLIEQTLMEVPLSVDFDPEFDGANARVELGVLMMMTSTDYLVQR